MRIVAAKTQQQTVHIFENLLNGIYEVETELLEHFSQSLRSYDKQIDILIVDLDMDGAEQAAAVFFRKNPETIILLLSENGRCIAKKECFHAVCLVKHESMEKIEKAVEECVTKYEANREKILLQRRQKKALLPIGEILYIESCGRTVRINGEEQQIYTAKLSELEQKLNDRGFLKIHRSIIINTGKCLRIRGYVAYMENGEALPCGRRNYREVCAKFRERRSAMKRP